MLKKFLLTLTVTTLVISPLLSQDATPGSSNLDKKLRFGLRFTPQPTWLISGDKKSATPSGTKLSFGFGLNVESRLSDIAVLLTGIGADIESAKYKFRNDPANNYQAVYFMNELNEFVDPNGETDGINNKIYKSNTAYILNERNIKTTYITVPIILKLSTKEINSLKYYGMFGCEIGVRVGAKATDSYYETGKYVPYNSDTLYKFQASPGIGSLSEINVGKESSGLPMRFNFNAGLGTEYRLSGSTAAFISINYSRALSNQMRKESKTTIYKTEPSNGKSTFIKQNLKMSAIRISIGIMF